MSMSRSVACKQAVSEPGCANEGSRTPASARRPKKAVGGSVAPQGPKLSSSLSPTEARIRDNLRRSARLRRMSMPDAS